MLLLLQSSLNYFFSSNMQHYAIDSLHNNKFKEIFPVKKHKFKKNLQTLFHHKGCLPPEQTCLQSCSTWALVYEVISFMTAL